MDVLFLAITNIAAMNIHAKVLVWAAFSFFLGKYVGTEWLKHMAPV